MADRIIKSDSGNDVVIQNNGGTRKIEVTNSGDVEVTGDVKTTTVKATNLKANDGTSGISIADSTGRVTFNENNPVIQLGSNTTFPSGHIIQTKTDTYNGAGTTVSSTADDVLGTNLEVTITPESTSNILIVRCLIGNYYNEAGSSRKLDIGFRYHADWTGTPVQLGPREFVVRQFGRLNLANIFMAAPYAETITTAPVTTSIKIRPWLQAPTGDVTLFNDSASLATLSVMEIQA